MKKQFDHVAGFLFSKGLKNIEILLLGTLLALGYCTNLLSVELEPDETFWITSSVRLEKFLAFDDPVWSDDPLLSYEVRPVPSYFVAIGQRFGGIQAHSLPPYWDWEAPDEENISRGAMPSDRLLWWSRLPMAIISVFSMLGVVLLLAKSHSRIAAYTFTIISFNDYFLAQLRRAWSEPPLILFTVLALYACYKLFAAMRGTSVKKVVLWAAAVGIFSGLAGESKLTGLACAGVAILGTIILMTDPTTSYLTKKRIPIVVTLIILGTSLLVFIGSYPFFYESTLDRIATTLATRNQVVEYQIYRYPEETIQSSDRPTILFQRIFNYPIHLDAENATIPFFHWINLILTAFGVYYCVKQVRQKGRDWEYFFVFLLGAFVCALPMLLTPFDWERYYLYPIFFSCIFFSLGIGELLSMWSSSIQRRQAEKLDELGKQQVRR